MAAAGDRHAFDALVRRHSRAVTAIAAERLSRPEDRADAVQDTFIKAWKGLPSLRDHEQFPSWLYAIARNAATSVGRTRSKHRADELDDDATAGARNVDDSLEAVVEAQLLAAAASNAMVALSERDAAVLTMTVNFGFTPADIAAALGVTEGNAAVILHRARSRLRRELVARDLID